jgi:hypothetical protein
MSDYPTRPPTPQAMLHRLPDRQELLPTEATRPSKYIILIEAPTCVAGKVQIAQAVSSAVSCPLFQGDSLHETSARAASVGAARLPVVEVIDELRLAPGVNEARYRRMWLSKMMRTGLLFPEESRPANEAFSGFGGTSSSSTSRRESISSISSVSSSSDTAVSVTSVAGGFMPPMVPTIKYVNKPATLILSNDQKLRKANPALMVVTHPQLEKWHKNSIRNAVGEYGIGIIFVPLYEDEELPILKPLDPKTMNTFPSVSSYVIPQNSLGRSVDEEIILRVNIDGTVADLIEDIVHGVREIMRI